MKAVILAGGLGTRLSEETQTMPKPMVPIGDAPILWHIMKIYSAHGINDFIICLGYKGHVITEYFYNYHLHRSDITLNTKTNTLQSHSNSCEDWNVTLVRTGQSTMTGGRLKRIRDYVKDETFCMTYGDGLSNVDITAAIAFHKNHSKLATVTAVSPPGRFGQLDITDNNTVCEIAEKPESGTSFINGGFFVLEPQALDRIAGDETSWEREPMQSLAQDGELKAFTHQGFWQPMDTLREKHYLEELWNKGKAPWKVWDESKDGKHKQHEKIAV